MLVSKLYAPTLREVPAEAVLESHKLMLRAGYTVRLLAGFIPTFHWRGKASRRLNASSGRKWTPSIRRKS